MPIVLVEGYDQIRLGDAVALEQIDAREYPQSGFSGREAREAREAREDEDIMYGAREAEGGAKKNEGGGGGGTLT